MDLEVIETSKINLPIRLNLHKIVHDILYS